MKTAAPILMAVILASSCVSEHGKGRHDVADAWPGPEEGLRPQTTCPVMEGKRINKRLYVDYEGFRIYVCCGPCVKAVRNNPAKHLRKLQDQGVAVEKAKEGNAE